MRVLVACEFSGIVRDAFLLQGHDAVSCDLIPPVLEGPYLQQDVLEVLDRDWDLMIAHPPCTYLSRAGARWRTKPGREELTIDAVGFVLQLANANIPRIAIENPIGRLNQLWRYPDQTIQPYQFGHPYSKATCLWLKGLPLLVPTEVLNVWSPLLPSNVGWNRKKGGKWHPGSAINAKNASKTFTGIAKAMAEQWGKYVG